MIIVKLFGGLGNQMFQYAVGRAIAYRNKANLKLDISDYRNDPKRIYCLQHFNIVEEFATKEDMERFIPKRSQVANWVIFQAKKRLYPCCWRPVVSEGKFSFNPGIVRIKDNAYLIGYWQSEKYFTDVADVIRRDFNPKNELDEQNKMIYEEIKSSDSVSLHIRRGDYVSDSGIRESHGVLPPDYYYAALDIVSQEIVNPVIYVFSDDIPWAKRNLKTTFPLRFMDHNGSSKDYEDLRLMSACKHHVIANSSFSWWGAWLTKNPQKIVISPVKWFNDPKRDASNLIPKSWMKI